MTDTTYEDLRAAYWDAQSEFRRAAIVEIQRRMPDAVHAVVLTISDTPRLTVSEMLDEHGDDILEAYDDEVSWDELDQIANDMEAFTWEEADSFLQRHGEGFVITREDV